MDIDKRKKALYSLGALDGDIEALLAYTQNVFSPRKSNGSEDGFLGKWEPVLKTARSEGAAATLNLHLVKEELQIMFESPETLYVGLFPSIGGILPVITTESAADFENMVRNIVYKGREVPGLSEMGAMFAFGKTNRFIILSDKPYSNVSAVRMGLGDAPWRKKSLTIRKHHECAHYYTKRFMGSSRNNLHDELIADFCGLYAAFGKYRAEWFLKFLGLSEDSDSVHGRLKVYTKDMSPTAADVIKRLAVLAANGVEEWTKTDEFSLMDGIGRIEVLCGKELLAYAFGDKFIERFTGRENRQA